MAGFEYNSDYYECNTTDDPKLYGVQYRVVNDLATEPVTLEFFKNHARIDFDTDDTLAESYLKAARIELEQWAQISFGVKTIGLTALNLPKNYRLMYGPVDTVTTANYTNVGDILKEGGKDLSIQYTTLGVINDAIRVAICRYAAGLYVNRENVIDTQFAAQSLQDEAKKMVRPFANLSWF